MMHTQKNDLMKYKWFVVLTRAIMLAFQAVNTTQFYTCQILIKKIFHRMQILYDFIQVILFLSLTIIRLLNLVKILKMYQ